jgi:RHS repeat-associated protein
MIKRHAQTGLYHYGTLYYNLQDSLWHSVDPLAEKYRCWTPYNYCVNNPMRFVDPDGMNLAEFKIHRETGEIAKVNDNQYYKTESGEVNELAVGESTESKNMVDKITNGENESNYFTEGSEKESSKKDQATSRFTNAGEGKLFYEFAAESSDVEFGAGEIKITNGGSEVLVGSNHESGRLSFIGRLEKAYGNDLLWASHSHPGSGGPPSYDLRVGNNLVGDLNAAAARNSNTNYEVYDVSNRRIYFYDKNSLEEARNGYQFKSKKK